MHRLERCLTSWSKFEHHRSLDLLLLSSNHLGIGEDRGEEFFRRQDHGWCACVSCLAVWLVCVERESDRVQELFFMSERRRKIAARKDNSIHGERVIDLCHFRLDVIVNNRQTEDMDT